MENIKMGVRRFIVPALLVMVVMLVGGTLLGGQAQGKTRMSGYNPGRDGSAGLSGGLSAGRAQVASASSAKAVQAQAPSGAAKVLKNDNFTDIPVDVTENTPYGPPVVRTDWLITKDYAAHGGKSNSGAVDFAFAGDKNAFGAPVVATHNGRVKLLTDDPTYGNLVYVFGSDYTTTYGHLQKFYVKEGDQVVRGQVLGEMGSTGLSTGPHVDYQVWRDGDNKNPMEYGIPGIRGVGVNP